MIVTSEVTAYTAPVYSHRASFHDAYRCLRHAHYRYRSQLPYKNHRTYFTNHMEFISHHIMPLVINSLSGGHTHTHKHTHAYRHSQTEAILRNQAHAGLWPARAWVKNIPSVVPSDWLNILLYPLLVCLINEGSGLLTVALVVPISTSSVTIREIWL